MAPTVTYSTEPLLEALLSTTPGGAAIFRIITSPQGTITDLLLVEANSLALSFWASSGEVVAGQSLQTLQPNIGSPTYQKLLTALETRTPQVPIWLGLPDYTPADTARLSFLSLSDSPDVLVCIHAPNPAPYWQTQHDLQQQSELLRSVLDGSQNQIIAFASIRDKNGKIVDFRYLLQNEANRLSVNRTEEQVIGHTMLEYFPHVIETGLFDRYVRVIETGQPDRFDMPYYYDELAGYYNISVVKRGDGIVLTLQNKTDNWLAEQRARHQAELLQQVVDHSPTGIILAEAIRTDEGDIIDFRYQLTNAFNAKLTGHTVEDMVGKPISKLFENWQSLYLFNTFKQVVETGENQQYPFEYNYYGVRGWFEGSFQKQGDGVLFTFLDISATKQAEVDQAVQALRLKAILDNSQTAISLHEAIRNEEGELIDFKTILANRLAIEKWGPMADQILDKPYSQLSPNPNAEVEFARFKHVIETGETIVFEFNYDSDWYLMAIAKMGDGLVISFIEITTIHRYREQLETANQELKRSNESLQQFAYVASHDLQEPLRKIMAFGNILTDVHRPNLGAGGADLVDRMQQSAKRMSHLIRDLLDYSRVSTLKDPFEQVDLNMLLADVQSDLEMHIRDSGASITVEPLPIVSGSPVQLQQLMQNLLSNAIKFGRKEQAPRVNIRCQLAEAGNLSTL